MGFSLRRLGQMITSQSKARRLGAVAARKARRELGLDKWG